MKLTKSKLTQLIKEVMYELGDYSDAPEGQEDYDYGYGDGSDRKPLEQDPAVPYHPKYLEGYKDGLYDSHMADNPIEKHAAAAPERARHASEMKARIAAKQGKKLPRLKHDPLDKKDPLRHKVAGRIPWE